MNAMARVKMANTDPPDIKEKSSKLSEYFCSRRSSWIVMNQFILKWNHSLSADDWNSWKDLWTSYKIDESMNATDQLSFNRKTIVRTAFNSWKIWTCSLQNSSFTSSAAFSCFSTMLYHPIRLLEASVSKRGSQDSSGAMRKDRSLNNLPALQQSKQETSTISDTRVPIRDRLNDEKNAWTFLFIAVYLRMNYPFLTWNSRFKCIRDWAICSSFKEFTYLQFTHKQIIIAVNVFLFYGSSANNQTTRFLQDHIRSCYMIVYGWVDGCGWIVDTHPHPHPQDNLKDRSLE